MRSRTTVAALAVVSVLTLAACGSDSDSGDDAAAATTTDSGITVTGGPGEKPTLDIPDEDPSDELVVEVLDEGDGAEVGADDFVVAHYLGQTWEDTEEGEPNVFDNSYDRDAASGFSLNGVIPGWKDGLAGQTLGSRVLLTIPPDQGYGDQDQETIPANSTLVFVVELVESIDPTATASGEAVADVPAGLPAVTTVENATPTVDFSGAELPAASDSTLVVAGDGEDLGDNIVMNLVQASYPDGADLISTWDQGTPSAVPTDQLASVPGLDAALEGQKVGSRVVARIAASDNVTETAPEGQALALVIDVIGTY